MIRSSRADDHEWIRATAARVYQDLGDYGTIIPSWLEHPGVMAFVDDGDGSELRGFILVGFYTPKSTRPATRPTVAEPRRAGSCVADLLAIAVAPTHQRHGVGRALLSYAVDVARAASAERPVPEIRLTVSEDNRVARSLFERTGFRVLDEDYGNYDGGQRAIRMSLALE